MEHLIENRGMDVYCHRCGKCWEVSDEVPPCDEPRWKAPDQITLKAFLVGSVSPGTNPCLVLGLDQTDAIGAIARPLGIHPSDLFAVAAPKIAPIVGQSAKAWWVIHPHQLEAATVVCADLLEQHFPGAVGIVNPFKMTKRK